MYSGSLAQPRQPPPASHTQEQSSKLGPSAERNPVPAISLPRPGPRFPAPTSLPVPASHVATSPRADDARYPSRFPRPVFFHRSTHRPGSGRSSAYKTIAEFPRKNNVYIIFHLKFPLLNCLYLLFIKFYYRSEFFKEKSGVSSPAKATS